MNDNNTKERLLMKKLAKLTALTMTAGMLLAACGDANDVDDDLPGMEDDMNGGLEDDGMEDDGLGDDLDDDTDE
jgi:hypothetical protein